MSYTGTCEAVVVVDFDVSASESYKYKLRVNDYNKSLMCQLGNVLETSNDSDLCSRTVPFNQTPSTPSAAKSVADDDSALSDNVKLLFDKINTTSKTWTISSHTGLFISGTLGDKLNFRKVFLFWPTILPCLSLSSMLLLILKCSIQERWFININHLSPQSMLCSSAWLVLQQCRTQ